MYAHVRGRQWSMLNVFLSNLFKQYFYIYLLTRVCICMEAMVSHVGVRGLLMRVDFLLPP